MLDGFVIPCNWQYFLERAEVHSHNTTGLIVLKSTTQSVD